MQRDRLIRAPPRRLAGPLTRSGGQGLARHAGPGEVRSMVPHGYGQRTAERPPAAAMHTQKGEDTAHPPIWDARRSLCQQRPCWCEFDRAYPVFERVLEREGLARGRCSAASDDRRRTAAKWLAMGYDDRSAGRRHRENNALTLQS